MGKIKCMICGKEFEQINNFHLKTHGITHKEYCERFPDAPLISEEMRKQKSEKITGKTPTPMMIEGYKKHSKIMTGRTKKEYEYLRKISEKLTGMTPTPAMIEGRKRQSEKMTGQTKENNKSVRKMAETLTGRTKEEYEYLKKAGEKRKGRTKEEYEYIRKTAEKLIGRTKENHEGVRRGAEKKKGRTKENDESVRIRAEKLTNQIGELNPNWRGGISFEPYCEKFDEDLKERVREFFGRCCYICGKSEQEQIDEMIKNGKRPIKKLDVHHVTYNKDTCCDNSKPLFVPLCKSCHNKTLGNREYWEEFFTVSLNYLTDGKCFYSKEDNTYKNRIQK